MSLSNRSEDSASARTNDIRQEVDVMKLGSNGKKMIAIIDYKAGNLRSVERALKKLGFACRITHDREEVLNSERIIFPGVGAAGKAIADLRHFGLDKALTQTFKEGTPILGICLGAQIILEKSEENNTQCLGLLGGDVKLFPSPLFSVDNERLKIPHMGWNGVHLVRRHPVLEGIRPQDEFYFVHSYYPMPAADHIHHRYYRLRDRIPVNNWS